MVEVWSRRDEPEGADLQRALHMAEILEGDPHSPTHLRAFAWHLAEETHRAVGWNLPGNVGLSSCRAAAASLSHATSLLKAEIAAEVHGSDCPVLLLGALAASRAIFGRWDLLPARGALLVACEPGEMQLPDLGTLPTSHGIHWAAPGRLQKVYEPHTLEEQLDGEEILLPKPGTHRGTSHRPRPPPPRTPQPSSSAAPPTPPPSKANGPRSPKSPGPSAAASPPSTSPSNSESTTASASKSEHTKRNFPQTPPTPPQKRIKNAGRSPGIF